VSNLESKKDANNTSNRATAGIIAEPPHVSDCAPGATEALERDQLDAGLDGVLKKLGHIHQPDHFEDEHPCPYNLRINTESDLAHERLGMTRAVNDDDRQTRNMLVGSLSQLPNDDWQFVQRNRNLYFGKTRMVMPEHVHFDYVIRFLDEAIAEDLLESIPQKPGRPTRNKIRKTSTYRPTTLFRTRWKEGPELEHLTIRYDKSDLTILRDEEGNIIRIPGRKCRIAVEDFNERLASWNVFADAFQLAIPGVDQSEFDTSVRSLRRIFNGKMIRGGRLYCGFWQSCRKEYRKALLINSEATVEEDYSAHHPTLLRKIMGLPVPDNDNDPYLHHPGMDREFLRFYPHLDMKDDLRPIAKVAGLAMMNANEYNHVLVAIVADLIKKHRKGTLDLFPFLRGVPEARLHEELRTLVKRAMAGVKASFPEFKEYWFSDVGAHLMAIDGAMAFEIITTLQDEGILALSVHDSFIVQERHGERLKQVMADVLDRVEDIPEFKAARRELNEKLRARRRAVERKWKRKAAKQRVQSSSPIAA